MVAWTREDIEARLSAATQPLQLTGEDLSGLDLSQLELSGTNMSGADLSGVILQNAQVRQSAYTSSAERHADLGNHAFTYLLVIS